MKSVAVRFALALVALVSPLGCDSPPPATPAAATAPVSSAEVACIPHDDAGVIRGLVVQPAADGHPVIRVGLFHPVAAADDQGVFDFDLASLTKVGGELAGSSEAREYAMRMKSTGASTATRVSLVGAWKLVRVLDGEIPYEDLVGTSWMCNNLASVDVSNFGLEGQPCVRGKQVVSSHHKGAADLAAFVDSRTKAFHLCGDPSPEALASFAEHEINVFTPSSNPLYPARAFYTQWGVYERYIGTSGAGTIYRGDAIKPAFQIYWLITKQKFKASQH